MHDQPRGLPTMVIGIKIKTLKTEVTIPNERGVKDHLHGENISKPPKKYQVTIRTLCICY